MAAGIFAFGLFVVAAIGMVLLFLKDFGFAAPAMRGTWIPFEHHRQTISDWKLFLTIAFICIMTRIVLIGAGGMIYVFANNMEPTIENIASAFHRMDANRYLEIAQNGYTANGDFNKTVNLAFFPFYPLLIHLISYVTGHNTYIAAYAVSNLCLIVSCFYLYKLALLDYRPDIARKSLAILLVFPIAFFFSITYTESTFLMLSILCAYYTRKQCWPVAGAFGMLCAFTRTQGILILIVCAYEYLLGMGIQKNHWKGFFKRLRPDVCWLLLIPLGYVAYLGVNKMVTGDWFAFLTYQKEFWGQSTFGLVVNNISAIWNSTFHAPTALEGMVGWGTQTVFIFSSLVLLVASVKRVRTSYFIYTLAYLFVSFSPASLISAPRYIMGAFPVFLMLAAWMKNRYAYVGYLFVSTVLLCFYTVAFSFQWYIY